MYRGLVGGCPIYMEGGGGGPSSLYKGLVRGRQVCMKEG